MKFLSGNFLGTLFDFWSFTVMPHVDLGMLTVRVPGLSELALGVHEIVRNRERRREDLGLPVDMYGIRRTAANVMEAVKIALGMGQVQDYVNGASLNPSNNMIGKLSVGDKLLYLI